MPENPQVLELDPAQLEAMLQRLQGRIEVEDFQLLQKLLQGFEHVLSLLVEKNMSIKRLRRLLFGPRCEKSAKLTGKKGRKPKKKDKPKGHGRKAADDYPGAQKKQIPLEGLNPKDACPECGGGKLSQKKPKVVIQVSGQPAFQAIRYEAQRLRCNLCGKVFSAPLPSEASASKYTPQVPWHLALLRFGAGMPFHRLEKLQDLFGVPLAASTQSELVGQHYETLKPLHQAMIIEAAQDPVFYNDDTTIKILSLEMKSSEDSKERRGLFTTGIVSENADRRIYLFFTGARHAGENLDRVLDHRKPELPPPIQMCDALSRNWPKRHKTLRSVCLLHGRRNFVDIFDNFPQECTHLVESLGAIYKNEAYVRERKMDPLGRLNYHRRHSQNIMDQLQKWMQDQLDQKQVEPNSGLGKAYKYMLKRWDALTLFLREPAAPLDNNTCERGLKMAILHRKNSLFYRTQAGADVGDLYMSFIHTCRHNRINPLDYFEQLHRNAQSVQKEPERWMPWNYRRTLEQMGLPSLPVAA